MNNPRHGEAFARGGRKLLLFPLLLLLGALFFLYLWGAAGARPGTEVALPDLTVVREWIKTGGLKDFSTDPGHLAKPGYLLFLKLALPQGGTDLAELRRLLVFQALGIATGTVLLSLLLWRRGKRIESVCFSLLILLCLPLRDAADYVMTEPLAISFSLLFGAALLVLPEKSSLGHAILGLAALLFALVRPNISYVLFAVAILSTASSGLERSRRVALLSLGFLAGLLLMALIERSTGLPVNPLSITSSQAILYGTADYAWPPEVGKRPVGRSAAENARLQREEAGRRWRDFFERGDPDRLRSLVWRLTHPILSAEQLPPRWDQPAYVAVDKLVRKWWWLAAALASCAAIACAVGGRGRWRFVALFLLCSAAAQGLLFGAETRYAYPLIPLAILGIVLPLPTIHRRPAVWAAAGATALFLIGIVWKVPDTVVSDYAVAGPHDIIRQRIAPSRFAGAKLVTVHLRLLVSPPDARVGYEILGNGSLLYRREPGDTATHPPYVTFSLAEDSLLRARRDGLALEIRALREGTQGLLVYPVLPPFFGSYSTINTEKRLPSGFGGWTQGAIPVWTHPGFDPLRR